MARLTEDPNDPELTHGVDSAPTAQASAYLVGKPNTEFVRPVRRSYVHTRGCRAETTMIQAIAETYARTPSFYGATYCVGCNRHADVAEFDWVPAWGEIMKPEQQVLGS